jgi:aspartyl/asparaginyl beta-hydroxylase (cupin superfamily)
MSYIFLLLAIITIIIVLVVFFVFETYVKTDKKFYSCKELYPELLQINNSEIINELNYNVVSKEWIDWPESHLYKSDVVDGSWKIIPFYGFGIWCEAYCKKFPKLTEFLKKIPGIRIALLSKLNPKTTLIPHYGWGEHSNNVLRCHYGIKLPKNKIESYIGVSEYENDKIEVEYHKLNDWIVFDDSKLHFATNDSEEELIVLIIDMKRPFYVKKGNSTVEETTELLELINEILKYNVNIT